MSLGVLESTRADGHIRCGRCDVIVEPDVELNDHDCERLHLRRKARRLRALADGYRDQRDGLLGDMNVSWLSGFNEGIRLNPRS